MTIPQITPLPEPPNRATDTQNEFSDKADDFLGGLPQFQTELNAFGDAVEDLGDEVQANADASAASAASSASSAAAAAESASLAQSTANFKGNWSDLTGALNVPASVYHNDGYWQLLVNLADVTASEPGVTTDWAPIADISFVPTQTASFVMAKGFFYQVEATTGDIDATLPVSVEDGDVIALHNSSASTDQVRLINSSYTLRGPAGTIGPGDNLIIKPGETPWFVARSATILEAA